MTGHFTDVQFRAYRERSLTGADLLLASDHLAACEECRAKIGSAALLRSCVDAIRQTLAAGSVPVMHLTYSEMAAYVDGELEQPQAALVEIHTRECEACADDCDALAAIKREMERLPPGRRALPGFWRGLMEWKHGLAVAATAACALLLIMTRPPHRHTPGQVPAPQPQVTAAATIRDGDRVFTIASGGSISGLDALIPADRATVEQALAAKSVETARVIVDLAGKRGVLLGSSARQPRVELLAPVGTVVEAERPVLRWKPLPGAQFQVSIYDSRFDLVASSEWIDKTEWRPERSLRRGVRYSWQLSVRHNGAEFTVPAPPDPEARFQILTAQGEAELQRLRGELPDSHLVLGLFYAKAGLLDDAVNELRVLNQQNSDSDTIAGLLASVEQLRSVTSSRRRSQ